MTDFNTVIAFVALEANQEQLQSIIEAIKLRREKLAHVAKFTLKSGQEVKFSDRGTQYAGKILSVRVKKATVEITSPVKGIYVVPLNMLKAA
jgi:hypothetical protein